jgi:hypothetical protein
MPNTPAAVEPRLHLRGEHTWNLDEAEPETVLEPLYAAIEAHAAATLLRIATRLNEETEGFTLFVALHPAAANVELSFSTRGITLTADTAAGGPGYHAHVTGLADALASRVGVRWDSAASTDSTGYFASRDMAALEQATSAWGRAVAKQALNNSELGIADQSQLSMPTGLWFATDDFCRTPLGPLTRAQVAAIADDETGATARALFPWWPVTERFAAPTPAAEADVLAKRALCLMWVDVRFRAPLSDTEQAALINADRLLTRAHELAPTLPLPWREWSEIKAALGEPDPAISARADTGSTDRPIGYRREGTGVQRTLGPWVLTVPADFADTWDEQTWVAYDGVRTVRFAAYEHRLDDGAPEPFSRMKGELETFDFEGVPTDRRYFEMGLGTEGRGRLDFVVGDSGGYWQLYTVTVAEGLMAELVVLYDDGRDLDRAVAIFRSLALEQGA